MTRWQFYTALFSVGAAGLTFAFRSPAAPKAITPELVQSMKRVEQVANAASAASQTSAPTSGAPAQPSSLSHQPWSERLRALSVNEGLNLAFSQLSTVNTLTFSDRIQMISYLREHESEDPGKISQFALQDLDLRNFPSDASADSRASYVENVAHLFLETSPNPEERLGDLIAVAQSYENPADRKTLIESYLQLFPEKKVEVERAIAGRIAAEQD